MHLNTHTYSDEEIIAEYRKSVKKELLGILYKRYTHLVYGVCLKYLNDPEESKDAVMNIFEKLFLQLRQHDIENFKSWLYTTARNFCLMELRKTKRNDPIENVNYFMESADEMHLNEKMNLEKDLIKLENCIETLKGEQKSCVKLFYLENKSYNEISIKTKKDIKKVKSNIQNGRRNLKNCMEE